MMVNTRMFLLYLLCVGFLIIAIVATYTSRGHDRNIDIANNPETGEVRPEYKAELTQGERVNREENLEVLRQKIAVINKNQVITPIPQPVETVVEEEEGEVEVATGEVFECKNYEDNKAFFLPADIKFEVVEGARLIYREKLVETNASSSLAGVMEREVLIQLPLRSFPMNVKNCLPYDIVAIAPDGSPIRNSEASVYSIFGPTTLVGYALDGFAIYGKSTSSTLDACGGEMVDGEYRYFLTEDRETVLNCFASTPIQI